MSILNIAAYRFVTLTELPGLQTALHQALSYHSIKGTVLLADEGINLFLAGEDVAVHRFLDWLRFNSRFAGRLPRAGSGDIQGDYSGRPDHAPGGALCGNCVPPCGR